MSTIITPNMNLNIPVVGDESGPAWASDNNNCFTLIDQHDHSSGKGVQITPAGLNINSDLTFLNNNAIGMRTVRFQANPSLSASDLDALFVNGVDLYYRDGNGNQVRITQAGAVSGTPGSIANLVSPASASYNAGTSTFVWQSAANTPANLDAASLLLRNLVANSKSLTLSPPGAMGADYTITLPALPGAVAFTTIDNSGAMGTVLPDNATLQISGGNLQVKDAGIVTAKIADANITKTKLVALGQQISASSGAFSTTSTLFVDVTNLTVTITTTGRPVFIGLMGDSSGGGSQIRLFGAFGANPSLLLGTLTIVRDATGINTYTIGQSANTNTTLQFEIPPSSLWHIDTPAAGTYVYKIQGNVVNASITLNMSLMKLIAYEL